jgi:hypothetical protein
MAIGETPTREHKGASDAVRPPTFRRQWQGVLRASVAALAIFVGLGRPRPLFGGCLARSRLRAELLPHPQRVPRDRGGHAGLSQHLRKGGTHRARRAAERTATMEVPCHRR